MKNTLMLMSVAVALAACREEQISVVKEEKEATPAVVPVAAVQPGGLRWTAPKGWTEIAGSGMRFASFRLPPPSDKAEVTVAVFPGDVGGELANVNRWRGQIALPPIEENALPKLRTRRDSPAGPVLLYDFLGPSEPRVRLIAASVSMSDSTWFFKLMGPQESVASARAGFLELLKSLHHDHN